MGPGRDGGGDAQRSRTAADTLGYTVTGIELKTDFGASDAVSDLPTVKLHSGSPSGTEVASFTRPSSIAGGSAVLEYTPATAVSLDANTTKDRC